MKKNKFSPEQREAFSDLEKIQDNGFGKVLTEILSHREYFKNNFKKIFDENIKELRETIASNFAERTLKHVALLLSPAKLLFDKLEFPFTFNEITFAVVANAIDQNKLLQETDEITGFWSAFAWGIKNDRLVKFNREQYQDNRKHAHYNLKIDEAGEAILQIKLNEIYPEYVKYCKSNGQRFLDKNSLTMLLTSKSYSNFIPNQQKNRGKAYTDFHFGSCYQFRFEHAGNLSTINNIELNL
ncbi:MAG: hypothetical protein AB7U05_08500 [Mangrovibacterium sp.]